MNCVPKRNIRKLLLFSTVSSFLQSGEKREYDLYHNNEK